ncbi:hypothetical protein [Promicromonospora iranensis]|uniref:Uncharacterized protein n=1 Tax=Promicromonospora iranensis TaxID=1105144 RepID=A0ABU2CLF2_9MICO|nr:hypothetical protein [Promicromonospora iranensis]MDR7382160.1 hypothetical protein [Promicromonospora iranensis]
MLPPSVRGTTSTRVLATAVAGLLTGLAAAPAAAAPGDPAPGWAPRPEEAHREVVVSSSGEVFVDASSEGGYKDINYLERGSAGSWVRTPDDSTHVTHLATGPGDYAVSVWHSADGDARYRLHDGTGWNDTETFYEGDVHASDMDANAAGDVSVLLRLHFDGGTLLARLPRGGEWTVQEVPGVPADIPADVVLNEQGKTTVVWAALDGETSIVRRSIVRAGSTTLSPPTTIGTLNNNEPNLSIVSDGEGRETLIGGNLLWRQPHTSRPLEYRLRTSVAARLAAGDTATRVVWPTGTTARHEVRSILFDDDVQQPQTTLWSHPRTSCTETFRTRLGIGMVPGGRSYVAIGVTRRIDSDGVCPDVTGFVTVDRADRVLNTQPLGYFAEAYTIDVAAGAAGPIAVEFKNWDDHADPIHEDQPDGRYSMLFFRR